MQVADPHPKTDTLIDTSSVYIKAPGTCGELFQGAIGEQDFLINCPVNIFSYAKIQRTREPGLKIEKSSRHTKIRDTITLASEEFNFPINHKISIHSEIPRGKGMASSTADITAAFEAICRSNKLSLKPETFTHIVTEIEPSDCVNFPGISHINHLTGQLFESFPAPSGMNVLAIDCGGQFDTISFDRLYARELYRKNRTFMCSTLDSLRKALHSGDLKSIAKSATRSATFNQKIHYKPQFNDLLRCTYEAGALGLNCAHSGTVLGVLYEDNEKLHEKLITKINGIFGKDLSIIGNFQIINGGCYEY